MKRILCIVLAVLTALCVAACGSAGAPAPTAQPGGLEADKLSEFVDVVYFTHYASGGTAEEYPAIILMEESNSTFTCYQVAYSGCTCRDSMANYYSVVYVELLNTKPSGDEAAIRSITMADNKGLWGDSNPNYYIAEYTQEYMDEHFLQPLVGVTKAEFDAWQGYGTQIDAIEADAVSGATVSTGNLTSMLRSLLTYHAEKYYQN